MAVRARTYLVINPFPLFAPDRLIVFRSSRSAGAVIAIEVDGRPVRVLLDGAPLNGGLFTAELLDGYL